MEIKRTEKEIRMAKDCIAVILKKVRKEISPEEYYSELMELHRKYPLPGHEPEFTLFQKKNYHRIIIGLPHPKNAEVKYSDHLRPRNFQEAAEMYIRSHPDIGMVTDFKQRAFEPEEREPGMEG